MESWRTFQGWLFSCLSFLWQEKGPKAEKIATGAAAPSESWWDPTAALLKINDAEELRHVLHRLTAGHSGQIPLSHLLLPLKRAPTGLAAWDEDEELTIRVEDIIDAAAQVDFLGCCRSLVLAFGFYDRDGDGIISAADLELALRDVVGEEGEEEEGSSWAGTCEAMVGAFDWEGVGGVCFDDFVQMMMICSTSSG